MLRNQRKMLHRHGLNMTARHVVRRILHVKFRCFKKVAAELNGKRGLEIGGPSSVFAADGVCPIYPLAETIDNCNYSSHTLWEGSIREGRTFKYAPTREAGFQYVCEASDLSGIASGTYDFVLSCHTLEHTANPLKAVAEWKRVLKENGLIIILVPHKEGTFDHLRPITSLNHLIADYEHGTTEGDLTHLSEILELHDLRREDLLLARDEFEQRSRDNVRNRSLHHHVFIPESLVGMFDYLDMTTIATEVFLPIHIVGVARKAGTV